MKKEEKQMLEELKEFTGKLDKYEKYFSMAVHNYIRITPEDTRGILEAYHGPDWKNKVKPSVMTCSTCKLNAIKGIAIEYYAAAKTVSDIEEKERQKAEKKKEKTEKKS